MTKKALIALRYTNSYGVRTNHATLPFMDNNVAVQSWTTLLDDSIPYLESRNIRGTAMLETLDVTRRWTKGIWSSGSESFYQPPMEAQKRTWAMDSFSAHITPIGADQSFTREALVEMFEDYTVDVFDAWIWVEYEEDAELGLRLLSLKAYKAIDTNVNSARAHPHRWADATTTALVDELTLNGNEFEILELIRQHEFKVELLNALCPLCGEFGGGRILLTYASEVRTPGQTIALEVFPTINVHKDCWYALTTFTEVQNCNECSQAVEIRINDMDMRGFESNIGRSMVRPLPMLRAEDGYSYCWSCNMTRHWCEECDESTWNEDHDAEYHGYDDDEDDADEYDEDQPGTNVWVRAWDHRPKFQFHPEIPTRKDGLYLGMEVEVNFSHGVVWGEVGRYARDEMPKLWYVKSDSSIDSGYEWVTHPFEPDWLLANFDEMVTNVMTTLHKFGAQKENASTGLHVHIAKDAFTPSHLYRFLQFHQNLSEMCGRVGGRGTDNSWGSFGALKTDEFKRQMKEIAKNKYYGDARRYTAVNMLPETTVELRYGAGTTDPKKLKAYIEWVTGVFEFTKSVKAYQAMGALKHPGNFLWWVNEQAEKYPDLHDLMISLYPQPVALETRS